MIIYTDFKGEARGEKTLFFVKIFETVSKNALRKIFRSLKNGYLKVVQRRNPLRG